MEFVGLWNLETLKSEAFLFSIKGAPPFEKLKLGQNGITIVLVISPPQEFTTTGFISLSNFQPIDCPSQFANIGSQGPISGVHRGCPLLSGFLLFLAGCSQPPEWTIWFDLRLQPYRQARDASSVSTEYQGIVHKCVGCFSFLTFLDLFSSVPRSAKKILGLLSPHLCNP